MNWRSRHVVLVGGAALVVLSIISVVVVVGMRRATEQARCSVCESNIGQLGMAILQYEEKYGHFPPAYTLDADDRRMHSWRVLVLEFLDPQLWREYDFSQPWDSPTNLEVAQKRPKDFACPNDFATKDTCRTDYFVVVGANTLFPGQAVTNRNQTVGAEHAVLLVESIGRDICWTEPRDLEFDKMSFVVNDPDRPSVSSRDPRGPIVIMADWTKARVAQWSPEALKERLTSQRTNEQR